MKDPENRPSHAGAKRARIFGVIFALGLPALVAIGGFLVLCAPVESSKSSVNSMASRDEGDVQEDLSRRPPPEDAGVAYRVWKARELAKTSPGARQAGEAGVVIDDAGTRWVIRRPDILEEPAPAPADPRDAGSWADPVNQRVLGPRAWMPEVSPAEAEAVERALDQPRPAPRYPIDLRVRQFSIDIAAEVVELCFGESAPRGRFAVNYRLVADGVRARFEDVHLSNIYGLHDPVFVEAFAGCVAENLGARSFRSSEDGQMQVARPFLFDTPPELHPDAGVSP